MGPDKTEKIGTCSVESCLLLLKSVRAICKSRRSQDCMLLIMLMLVSAASGVLL